MIGRPKKPPRVRMQIVFRTAQAKRLRAFAKSIDCDISQVVRIAVDDHLERENPLTALVGVERAAP